MLKVKPAADSVEAVIAYVDQFMMENGLESRLRNRVKTALDDMYFNVVSYSGADSATVECAISEGALHVIITDNGEPFNPLERPEPDITLSAEERGIGGLGIFMARKLLSDMKYEYRNGNNHLTLIMKL